jgi:PIN domain nuclease of toxin-antitoxin system
MITYVLDASALIRLIDNEPGANRVEKILSARENGQAEICLSAVQWGEVVGNTRKRFRPDQQVEILNNLLPKGSQVIAADRERAEMAARWKVDRRISYADAFALDLAMKSPEHILVTADYGFKAVEDLARIEFLPVK